MASRRLSALSNMMKKKEGGLEADADRGVEAEESARDRENESKGA